MARINVMNAIEEARKNISSRYDVSFHTLVEITEKYSTKYQIASAAFCLGYGQGFKAAKAKKNQRRERRIIYELYSKIYKTRKERACKICFDAGRTKKDKS